MSTTAAPSYVTVTEQPGQAATRRQLTMMAARYAWARSFAQGSDVLEVACGAGIGLGMLAEVARVVEAGDIDPANLEAARKTYRGLANVHIRELDALDLPYRDESFDLVLLFEAIYYLADAWRFVREAHRVLKPGGRLLIATVNCQWRGFNPSPFSVRYFGAEALRQLLKQPGFSVDLRVAFPEKRSLRGEFVSMLRRIAVALNLLPRTMAGKALLKRVFYGALEPIPGRIDSAGYSFPPSLPVEASADGLDCYSVLYAAARKDF